MKITVLETEDADLDGQTYALAGLATMLDPSKDELRMLYVEDAGNNADADADEELDKPGWLCLYDDGGMHRLYCDGELRAKVLTNSRGLWYAWAWVTGGSTYFSEGACGDPTFTPWRQETPANVPEPD